MKSKNFLLLALMIFLPLLSWAQADPVNLNKETVAVGSYRGNQYQATIQKYVLAGTLPTVSAVTWGGEAVTFSATEEVYQNGTSGFAKVANYATTADKGYYYLKVMVAVGTGADEVRQYIFVPFVAGDAVEWTRVNSASSFAAAMVGYNEVDQTAGGYWMYYQQKPWCDVWYAGDETNPARLLYPGQDIDGTGESYYPDNDVAGKTENDACDWYADLITTYGKAKFPRSWENATSKSNRDNVVLAFPNPDAEDAFEPNLNAAARLGQPVWVYGDQAKLEAGYMIYPGRCTLASVTVNSGVSDFDNYFGLTEDQKAQTTFAENFSVLLVPVDANNVTLEGLANLDAAQPVTITKLTAENTIIDFTGAPFTYNGDVQKPATFTVTYQETANSEPVELTDCDFEGNFTFEVVYPYDEDDNAETNPDENNSTNYEDAGTKPFVIVAKGDYWGEIEGSYVINPFDISDEDNAVTVTYTNAFTYNGSVQQPADVAVSVTLKAGDSATNLDKVENEVGDFTVNFDANGDFTNVGDKSFTITGTGNYTGTIDGSYDINPRTIVSEGVTVTYTEPDYIYNGKVQAPAATAIVVTDAAIQVDDPTNDDPEVTIPYTLVNGTDYELAYSDENSTNAGDYTITITGKGNYAAAADVVETPSVKKNYTILKKALTTGMFEIFNNFTYDGKKHPVNEGEQVDFTASYKGEDGKLDNKLSEEDFTYDLGDEQSDDFVAVGNYKVTFTATPDNPDEEYVNNFTGSVILDVNIVGAALWINAAQTEKIYGEKDPAPKFTVDANSPKQLARAQDYAAVMNYLTFNRYNGDNGEDVGEHNYYIAQVPPSQRTGLNYDILIKDNTSLLIVYKRPAKITIEPTEKALGDAEPTFIAKPVAWDGEAGTIGGIIASDLETVTPAAPAEPYQILKDGVATITRDKAGTAEGENIGEYPFTVTSKNYDLTFTPANFTITPASAAGAVCTIADAVYNGQPQTPQVTVVLNGQTLIAGTDYTIDSWANNQYVTPAGAQNAQKMQCTVHFTGNYDGTPDATAYGQITKRPVLVTPSIKAGVALETGYTFSTTDVELNYSEITGNANSGLVNDKEWVESDANSFVRPTYEAQATADPTVFNIVKKTDGSSKNYEFVYANGSYTIGRAVLTIHVSGTKVYGQDEEDAVWTVTAEGWKNGETEAQQQQYLQNDFGTGYFFEYERKTAGKENPEDVGFYDINITGPSVIGEEGNGYSVVYDDQKFEITKAPLTITAQPAEKWYGDADPQQNQGWGQEAVAWPVEFSAEGLVNGDTEDDAKFYTQTITMGQGWQQFTFTVKHRTYNVTREPSESIGEYVIQSITPTDYASQSVLRNYNVTWKIATGAKLKIKALDVTVKVSDATITYGQTYTPNIEVVTPANLSNARKAEVIEAIKAVTTGTPAVPVLAYAGIPTKTPINAGTYTITATGPAAAENFTVSAYNPGTLTVEPYVLAVKANDQSIIYASDINPYDVTIGEKSYRLAGDIFQPTGDEIKDVIALNTDITHVGTFTPDDEPYGYELNPNYAFAEEDDFEQGYLTIRRLDPLPLGAADLKAAIIALGKTAEEAEAWPLKQVLADHTGIEVNVVMPSDRSMAANDWYSWVLPFDVTPRMLSKDNTWGYAACDILDVKKSKENNVVLALTVEKIPANTPFVAKVDETIQSGKKASADKPNKMGDIVFENVTIADFDYLNEDPQSVSEDESVAFIGVYELKDDLAANEWALTRKGTAPRKFQPGPKESGVGLTQTRAYIWTTAESAADVRIFVQEPDGTTTEISDVDVEDAAVAADGWYTVNGVKLEGEPTVTGTYIFNGKKVFIQK